MIEARVTQQLSILNFAASMLGEVGVQIKILTNESFQGSIASLSPEQSEAILSAYAADLRHAESMVTWNDPSLRLAFFRNLETVESELRAPSMTVLGRPGGGNSWS